MVEKLAVGDFAGTSKSITPSESTNNGASSFFGRVRTPRTFPSSITTDMKTNPNTDIPPPFTTSQPVCSVIFWRTTDSLNEGWRLPSMSPRSESTTCWPDAASSPPIWPFASVAISGIVPNTGLPCRTSGCCGRPNCKMRKKSPPSTPWPRPDRPRHEEPSHPESARLTRGFRREFQFRLSPVLYQI